MLASNKTNQKKSLAIIFRIALLLALSIIFPALGYHYAEKNNRPTLDSLNQECKMNEAIISQINYLYNIALKSENININKVKVANRELHKTQNLTELNKQYDLFMILSEVHCWSCIFESIQEARSFSDLKIGFLLHSHSEETSEALILQSKIPTSNIYIISDLPNLPVDEILTPYFFQLNDRGRTKNVFVPIKGQQQRTKIFLETLTEIKLSTLY
ncbi:MAG: hypothetical protein Q4A44_02040 [Bacteroidales bacterium]|nr:hypothetical protein [Bacteroidales bacterium]